MFLPCPGGVGRQSRDTGLRSPVADFRAINPVLSSPPVDNSDVRRKDSGTPGNLQPSLLLTQVALNTCEALPAMLCQLRLAAGSADDMHFPQNC